MRAVSSIAAVVGVWVAVPLSAATAAPPVKACPSDKVWSESQGGCVCAPGSTWDDATRKCVSAKEPERKAPDAKTSSEAKATAADPRSAASATTKCTAGTQWSEAHDACVPACPRDHVRDAKNTRCISLAATCPTGTKWSDVLHECVEPRPSKPSAPEPTDRRGACPAGKERVERDTPCVPVCPAGTRRADSGRVCVSEPKACAEGKEWKDAWNACVPVCAADQVLDWNGTSCRPIKPTRQPRGSR